MDNADAGLILFDEGVDRTAAAVEAVDATGAQGGADGAGRQRSAREEVESWLDAVALCFGLPEGRRWIEPERLLLDPVADDETDRQARP